MEQSTSVAVRLTEDQMLKLKRLQQRTRRSRADVLRMLIEAAAMPSRADIRIDERRLHSDDEW